MLKLRILDRRTSPDGASKYLFGLPDGNRIETVFFRMSDHRQKDAVCVSSQVGCSLTCSFCVTGTLGLKRNLSAEEIAAQVTTIYEAEDFTPSRHHEVAYMGMGEPLHNLEGVLGSKAILSSAFPRMLFGISTVGIVPSIEQLIVDPRANGARLQISLHSARDDVRTQIMAINRRFAITDVLNTAERFVPVSGHPVTVNYVLMKGINDSVEDAQALCRLIEDRPFMVQLVIVNPDPLIPYQPAKLETVGQFKDLLSAAGIIAFHSPQLGTENGGGCGQLDADYGAGALRRGAADGLKAGGIA